MIKLVIVLIRSKYLPSRQTQSTNMNETLRRSPIDISVSVIWIWPRRPFNIIRTRLLSIALVECMLS